MTTTPNLLLPGHYHAQLDSGSDIITRLIQVAATAGVRADPRLITHFYLTLQARRLVILAGPPQSGKIALVQSLAQVLTGGDPLQCQMMVGHAWWAGRSGDVGLFTAAQTRFNTEKILAVIEEALRPENAQRVYIVCLTRISPAEVSCFFSEIALQLQHSQLIRLPGVHLTQPIPYPPNLFLIGTMDTPPLNGLNPDLLSNLTVIQWPAVEVEPAGSKITTARHNFWTERRWSLMAKDPVCGMDVDEKTAAGKSEYQGQTYYFCSVGCKKAFDKEPQKYVGKVQTHSGHQH